MILTPITNPVALKLDTTVGTRIFAGTTMIYGDTGWRDVGFAVDAAFTATAGNVIIRRIGDEIFWRIKINPASSISGLSRTNRRTFLTLSGLNATPKNPLFAPFATGFLNMNSDRFAITNASSGGLLQIEQGSLTGTWVEGDTLNAQFSYITNSAWPTILPGVAA